MTAAVRLPSIDERIAYVRADLIQRTRLRNRYAAGGNARAAEVEARRVDLASAVLAELQAIAHATRPDQPKAPR